MFRKGLAVSKFIVIVILFALIMLFLLTATAWKIW